MTYDQTNYGDNGATSPAKAKFIASAASKGYKGPSVVDFLNLSGYDSSPASRVKLAGDYGVQGYNTGANNGAQNTALLNALRASGNVDTTASPTGNTTGSSSETPASGGVTPATTPSGLNTAFQTYLDSLRVDKTSDARSKYADFIASRDQGINNLEGRGLGIPLSLVRGQQSKLMAQSDIEGRRLQDDVQIAQGDQEAARLASKARLDFETGNVDRVSKAEKEKADREAEMRKPFDLSPGQERYQYNEKTGQMEKVASVAPKPTAASATTEKSTKSGKLNYTAQDKAEDSQALERSRGTDGYVDPTIYQKLAKAWTDNGGQIEDFLNEYPPKLYVNPANTWLPAHLRPASKAPTDDLSWLK